jgi:uncharacterized coiled-coil DUF342 family protein
MILKQFNLNYKNEVRLFLFIPFSLSYTSIDRTQDTAVNDREDHYKSQIKEYQVKNDQSTHEIQDLRSKLTKSQEEKTTFNDTINSLRHDLETIQSELQERGKIIFVYSRLVLIVES